MIVVLIALIGTPIRAIRNWYTQGQTMRVELGNIGLLICLSPKKEYLEAVVARNVGHQRGSQYKIACQRIKQTVDALGRKILSQQDVV